MDIIDLASDCEQAERDALIAARLNRETGGQSCRYCEDCGGAIPEERRAIGHVTRCIECQTALEKRQGRTR